MKIIDVISMAAGVIGGVISAMVGGWSSSLTTLLIFMAADYITGLIVAGVFKRSTKSETGALESKAGWKGLCRKGVTLLFVLVACRLNIMFGVTYIRDGVIIAFIFNELVSLTENAGLMGVRIPKQITNAIDVLRQKVGASKDENNE